MEGPAAGCLGCGKGYIMSDFGMVGVSRVGDEHPTTCRFASCAGLYSISAGSITRTRLNSHFAIMTVLPRDDERRQEYEHECDDYQGAGQWFIAVHGCFEPFFPTEDGLQCGNARSTGWMQEVGSCPRNAPPCRLGTLKVSIYTDGVSERLHRIRRARRIFEDAFCEIYAELPSLSRAVVYRRRLKRCCPRAASELPQFDEEGTFIDRRNLQGIVSPAPGLLR